MPEWLEPMAATLTEERFSGPEWLFERKFDGIRLLAYKRGRQVELYSRNRLPQELPEVAEAIRRMPADELILDGEVAWDGRSSYHVFDVLWLDGRAVTSLPLEDRRSCASCPSTGRSDASRRFQAPSRGSARAVKAGKASSPSGEDRHTSTAARSTG
jgi:ATP-dependent DNA ligase